MKLGGGEGRNRTVLHGAKRQNRSENSALFKRTLRLLFRTPRVLFTDTFTDSWVSILIALFSGVLTATLSLGYRSPTPRLVKNWVNL